MRPSEKILATPLTTCTSSSGEDDSSAASVLLLPLDNVVDKVGQLFGGFHLNWPIKMLSPRQRLLSTFRLRFPLTGLCFSFSPFFSLCTEGPSVEERDKCNVKPWEVELSIVRKCLLKWKQSKCCQQLIKIKYKS